MIMILFERPGANPGSSPTPEVLTAQLRTVNSQLTSTTDSIVT